MARSKAKEITRLYFRMTRVIISEQQRFQSPIHGERSDVQAGTIAGDQLRQLRNLFVVTVTLASRAAIRGGMSEDGAFTLSDLYIRQIAVFHRSLSGFLLSWALHKSLPEIYRNDSFGIPREKMNGMPGTSKTPAAAGVHLECIKNAL